MNVYPLLHLSGVPLFLPLDCRAFSILINNVSRGLFFHPSALAKPEQAGERIQEA